MLITRIIVFYVDGHVIKTKADHPFFTGNGWVDAADLRVGDLLRTHDGSWASVQPPRSSRSPFTGLSPSKRRKSWSS